jgi:hypothetical protein
MIEWFKAPIGWIAGGIFAPPKFFSFSRGAKFGEFRPTLPAQVVCGSAVGE